MRAKNELEMSLFLEANGHPLKMNRIKISQIAKELMNRIVSSYDK